MGALRQSTFATLTTLLLLGAGCSSAHATRSYDSIIASDLVEPSLLPPRPPPPRRAGLELSAWRVEEAKDLDDLSGKLIRLLKERNPTMIAFGELYTPWWLPEYSAPAQFASHVLPRMARELGFRDLVCEYLTQDLDDADIAAALAGKPAPSVEAALDEFYASEVLSAARGSDVRLEKGGYRPGPGRRWTLDDLAVRGAPNGRTRRCNPHYVDITAEIKKSSLEHLLRLRSRGRKAMFLGGAEIAELEGEVDFLSAPAFQSDEARYEATRDAGAMGADLRALGLDREYAFVLVLPANHIQHQGRLNEVHYERLWRLKRKWPRLCWRTVGGSLEAVLLLPYESHRITNMDVKVRTGPDAN